jgi:hypothetical protein
MGGFFTEKQFIMRLFTKVNVSGFMTVSMKLLNTETLIIIKAIWDLSLNIQDFISIKLPTQGMMELLSLNKQCIW